MKLVYATLILASGILTARPMTLPQSLTLNCPKWCTEDVDVAELNSPPGNVSFDLHYIVSVPGVGTEYCATCEQCWASIHLSFNGQGTGYCMDYQTATAGSTDLTLYSRGGILRTNCDGTPDQIQIWVKPCNQAPQAGDYTKSLLLYCICPI